MNDHWNIEPIGFHRQGQDVGQQKVQEIRGIFKNNCSDINQQNQSNRIQQERNRSQNQEERKFFVNSQARNPNPNQSLLDIPHIEQQHSNRQIGEINQYIQGNFSKNIKQNQNETSSQGTVISDIPQEEVQTIGNQIEEQLKECNLFEDSQLIMQSIQWQKDSHGLFDYEMKQIIKQQHKILTDKKVLRKGAQILFVDPDEDIRGKYENDYQELFTIRKIKNKFQIHGVEPLDLNEDIDDCYLESGEPILPPIYMRERMYNVPRFLKVGKQPKERDFILKKNDIIKIGRVKLKVQKVYYKQKQIDIGKKLKRRNQRLDNEMKQHQIQQKVLQKSNIEYNQGQQISLQNQNMAYKSKYPQDYLNISKGSDKSSYNPIVGEKNYIQVKIPKKRNLIEEQLNLSIQIDQMSDQDLFEMKRQNPKQNFQEISDDEKNKFLMRNSLPQLMNGSFDSKKKGNSLSWNSNSKENNQMNHKYYKQSNLRSQNSLMPRNQRDITGNKRQDQFQEKEKLSSSLIQKDNPSTLLQQIQRDLNENRNQSNIYLNGQQNHFNSKGRINEQFEHKNILRQKCNQINKWPEEEKQQQINDNDQEDLEDIEKLHQYLERKKRQAIKQLNCQNKKISQKQNNNNDNIINLKNDKVRMSSSNQDQSDQFGLNRKSSLSFQMLQKQLIMKKYSNLLPQSIDSNPPIHSMDQVVDYQIQSSSSMSSSSLSSHKSWQENKRQKRLYQRRKIRVQKKQQRNKKREKQRLEQERLIESHNLRLNCFPQQSQHIIQLSKINFDGSDQSVSICSKDFEIGSNLNMNQLEQDHISIVSETNPNCRLCWVDEFNQDNPLLQICECRGGLEFIHFQCLKSWLKTKEYRQFTHHYTSIYWRDFKCEICNYSLPYVFRNNNRNYSLIDIPTFQTDYIVLESVQLEHKHSRMVHILHPNFDLLITFNEKYKLGRGQNCEIKISDLSVSRFHCEIRYKNGKFSIQDTASKYGTLLLARQPVEITSFLRSAVQVGRSLFVFQTQPIQPKKYNLGNFIELKKAEAKQIISKFRNQRYQAKNEKEYNEKNKQIQNNVLRLQEEDINHKYNLKNINLDEFLDYLEKEIFLEDFQKNQLLEHQFLLCKEQQDYQRLQKIEEFKNDRLNSLKQKKELSQLKQNEIAIQKKGKKINRIKSRSLSINNDGNLKEEINNSNQRNDFEAYVQIQSNIKKLQLYEPPLSIIKQIEENQLEPNLKKGFFKNIQQNYNNNNENAQLSQKIEKEEIQIIEQEQYKYIKNQLNKGVKRTELQLNPSNEYLKAIEVVEKLGGIGKVPDRNEIMDSIPNNFEKQSQYQQRLIISLNLQKKYLESERAKLLQGDHTGKSLDPILGVKLQNESSISKSFYKHEDKKNNILQQLNEKKRQILMLGLYQQHSLQLINVQQENKNFIDQFVNDQKEEFQSEQDQRKNLKQKIFGLKIRQIEKSCDKKIREIDQEIKNVLQFDEKHQELIKSQSQIHKDLQDIWRRQLQAQKDSQNQYLKMNKE